MNPLGLSSTLHAEIMLLIQGAICWATRKLPTIWITLKGALTTASPLFSIANRVKRTDKLLPLAQTTLIQDTFPMYLPKIFRSCTWFLPASANHSWHPGYVNDRYPTERNPDLASNHKSMIAVGVGERPSRLRKSAQSPTHFAPTPGSFFQLI